MHLGIDISVYQTGLTYQAIRAAGYEFAYIRMTQGTTIKDGQAPTHVAGCISAGIKWGGYHFFVPGTPSADQANYFWAMLSHFPKADLPPMIDVEWEDPLGWADLAKTSMDCLRLMENATGDPSGIYYCNPYFAQNLPGFPFTRQVGIDLAAPTSTPPDIPHILRQLAPGPVPGCPTPVDIDQFVGTELQWASFTNTQPLSIKGVQIMGVTVAPTGAVICTGLDTAGHKHVMKGPLPQAEPGGPQTIVQGHWDDLDLSAQLNVEGDPLTFIG